MSPTRKRIIILAGPNGAGKTTFAREFLPDEAECPADVVRRRFSAGNLSFEVVYEPLVDAWALYDNSNGTPLLLSWGEKS